jgi:hypothetical protein
LEASGNSNGDQEMERNRREWFESGCLSTPFRLCVFLIAYERRETAQIRNAKFRFFFIGVFSLTSFNLNY